MSGFFDNLTELFTGKKKDQGADTAPSLLSGIGNALASGWQSFVNAMNESNTKNIQSGNYSMADPSQPTPQSQAMKTDRQWRTLPAQVEQKEKTKKPWELDNPFGEQSLDDRYHRTVYELYDANREQRNRNPFEDAYKMTYRYANDIFQAYGLNKDIDKTRNPFDIAEKTWDKDLDYMKGVYAAEGKSGQEQAQLLAEGGRISPKEHRQRQEQNVIDTAQKMQRADDPYFALREIGNEVKKSGQVSREQMGQAWENLQKVLDKNNPQDMATLQYYSQRLGNAKTLTDLGEWAGGIYEQKNRETDDSWKRLNAQAGAYERLADTLGSVRDNGGMAYGISDPNDAALYQQMMASPKGKAIINRYMNGQATDADIKKYGQTMADALRNSWQPAQMTYEQADKYLSEQMPMYWLAKDQQGRLDDYTKAYGDIQKIGEKSARREQLTLAEEQAWNEAVQDLPWLGDWRMNLDGTGASRAGEYAITAEQQRQLAEYGAKKQKELADVAGLYSPYAMSDYNRGVWEQYVKTPEGAEQWYQESVGTDDEQPAWDNQYFVNHRTDSQKFRETEDYQTLGQPEEQYMSDPLYASIAGKTAQGLPGVLGQTFTQAGSTIAFMKPEDRQEYFARYKKYGKENAEDFYKYVEYENNKNATDLLLAGNEMLANKNAGNAIAMDVASVGFNQVGGLLGLLDLSGQYLGSKLGLKTTPMDYNGMMQMPHKYAENTRETIDNNLQAFGDKIHPLIGTGLVQLHDAVMSLADSRTGGVMAQGLGLGNNVAAHLAALIVDSNSGLDTMHDIHDRGGNNDESAIGGLFSSLAEHYGEKVGLKTFLDDATAGNKRNLIEGLLVILHEAGENALQEGVTELADIISDKAVMGDKSEWDERYNEYLRLTDNDEALAAKMVYRDFGLRVAQAAGSGALMGTISGGAANVANNMNVNAANADIGSGFSAQALDTLYSLAGAENAPEKAKNLAKKYQKENASARQVGEIFRAVVEEANESVRDSLHNVAAADIALQIGRQTGAVDTRAADAVADMMAGKTLSGVQVAAIAQNRAALSIVNELFKPDAEAKGDAAGTGAATGEGVSGAAARISQEPVQFEPMPGMELPGKIDTSARGAAAGAAAEAPKINVQTVIGQDKSGAAQRIESISEDEGGGVRVKLEDGQSVDLEDAGLSTPMQEVARAAAGMDRDKAAALMNAAEEALKKGTEGVTSSVTPDGATPSEGYRPASAENHPLDDFPGASAPLEGKALGDEGSKRLAADVAAGRDFALGFSAVYDAAAKGQTREQVRTVYGEQLAEDVREKAYEAGRQAFERLEEQARQRNMEEAKAFGFRTVAETVNSQAPDKGGPVGVLFDRVGDSLRDKDGNVDNGKLLDLKLIDRVFKQTGMQARVVDKLENDANGKYVHGTNIVYLSMDAEEGAITRAASHEGFHFISAFSPDMKKTITDFVLDRLGRVEGYDLEQRIKEVRQRYRDAAGQELEQGEDRYHDGAIEEIVADSMLDVIGTEENMRALMKESKSTAEKIREWITNTYQKFKDILNRLAGYSPETAALKDDVDYLGKISEMWNEGARQAAEAWQQAQAGYNDSSAALEQNQAVQQYRQEMQGDMTVEDRENSLTAFLAQLFMDTQGQWIQAHMDEYEEGLAKYRQALLDYKRGGVALNVALERAGLNRIAGNDIRVASYAAEQALTLEGAKERAKAREDNQVDSDSGESYSLPNKKQDDDYMAAVENGDEETARRLVDEAAREAGYVVATYHGTSEKFNEFNMGNEGIHLGDEDVARQVAELRFNWRSKESQYKWADIRDKVNNMDEEQRESLANAAYLLGDYIDDSADIFPYEGDLNDTDALTAYVDNLVQRYEENGGGWYGKGKTKLRLRTFDRKTGAYVMKMFARLGNPFVINGDIGQWTPQNIADVILRRAQGENELPQYDGNVDITGTEITIDGNALNELEAIAHNGRINEEVWERLANVLQRLGYDGIKYKNQYEGDKNNWSYLALRPNDVKRADTVTYDDAGNVIPLRERFNVGSKDIRYSMPTQRRQEDNSTAAREAKPIVTDNQGNDLIDELPGGTVASGDVKYSFSSLTPREKQHIVDALTKKNFEQAAIEKWMNDLQTIAAIIGADRERLDFVADPEKRMLKKNAEYIKTLDASTLCAKRLLYQGTFDAIQHRLPNTPLLPTDLIDFANMMREMGYETPCGICYVESRRRHLGEFVEKWLAEYKGAYKPTVDQVTTSDGLEELRKTHPQAYQDFISAMNKKGVMNPKIVQLRTDYRGDIRRMGKRQVQKVKDIGGLRIQSFSDFETPHLLDMVQAVMDMAAKELTAQAYTKVPNFAWVFGDTGIKINLSLIGKGEGVDANGNLLFDDKEGMPFDEAIKIRNKYSKNVGTILVGINDRHILAAMADDRIDFIIPFHKSGWSQEELNRMPVLNGYSDYTNSQNERRIIGKDVNGNYITESLEKTKRQNFQPVGENGYWEFEKSGKENAEKYLRMCAEDGRMPKFAQFLHDNGDGSWSLQADGSTDGYWKTLIDFKMYDNKGVGSPQTKVLPNINMKEAKRVLNEYTLDRNGIQRKSNNDLPVARPVVERYVAEYKEKNPRERYSLPSQQRQKADAAEAVRQDAELYAQMRQDADSRAALELIMRMHQQTTEGGENALIKPGAFEKRLGEMVERIKEDTATRMSDRAIRKGLRTIYQAMEKPGYSVGEILTYAKEFYQQVLEQAPGALVEMDDSTREAVRVLRENPFQLTPDQKSEIKGTYGSLGDFMRKNFGKLKIRNGAKVTLADVWRESLNPLNPGLFAEDTAEADMPGIIDAFLENAHEKKFAGEFGANIGAMSTDGALNLMLDFYDVPGAYKQKSEVRAEYQERFDQARALVNQYRQEARQAMNTARAEYQQKYRERLEKDRQTKAEREAKQGVINEIKRNVKPLKTMLVKGTDNRHIPEAMRGAMERMLNNLGVDRAIFSGQEAKELYMKLKRWAADSQLHDAAEAAAYDPDILAKLEWLEEHAGKSKALRDMTMQELEAVRDAVQNMYKMVTEENEIEVAGRKRKVSDLAGAVMGEMKDKKEASSNPVLAFLRKVGFKEMTPVYYAKQVGGTLGDLINDMIRSESDVAFIIKDAKAAFDKAAEKYHLNEWIHDKNHLRFQTSAGDTIELTREQAMTLYAWAEREKRNKTQSAAHLRRGGFTYDRNDKDVKQMKGVNFTKSHVLSDVDVLQIDNWLTDEQRAFAQEMIKYLSENMAEKGNEASMRMFGWKKFGEKWYFPYPTDRNFRGKNSTDAKGQPDKQIKYMGSSHALTEKAMNPLKLANFTDIWAEHVDEMARYSVMAEKLDNLQRVTNYVVGGYAIARSDDADGFEEVVAPESVKKEIERALGQEGAHYLEQLIRDANGGVMGDERGLSDRFISLFKKGSVAANLSVILQQPSAFVRAMSMVNPRYFGRGLHEHGGYKATRERMYANSGVANLKQWGGFDTNTGGSFANTLLDSVEKDGKREKAKAIIDEWTGKGAEKADEITWVYMYSAIEAEIDDRTDYKRGTEEFNRAVARRFDEVMRATQVYDSSMAKSEWMRSTSTMDKVVTSFMAEPTLWINMMMDAALDLKNNAPGARGKAARALGVFVAGTFVNSLLQSIATALRRKKDEGTTIVEKYLSELASNFTDSLSIEGIASMIPIARDIVSLFQGYDVERADMAVIGNMIDAWRKMEQHLRKGEMPDVDEWMNLAGMAGNLFGVPVRNIYRDVSGIIMNTFGGASSPIGETSGRDILYSVLDDTSWNSFVKLWDPSNAAYYDRMEQALIKGDMDKYKELRGYLEDTKKVKADTITTGIKNELKESVLRGLVTEEKAVDIMVSLLGVKDEKTAYDQIDKYVAKAKANGDEEFEYSKYAGLMDAVQSGGDVEAEIKRLEERGNARKTVVSNIKSQVKEWYLAGDMTRAQAEKALKTYVGISDTDNYNLYWTLEEWDWLKANPNGTYKSYGNIFDAVDSGNAQAIKAAVQKHLDHPHTKQMATDVHRQITDHFKPIYVELWNKGKKTEAANLKAAILTAYEAAGYARDMKNKDIEKWLK